MITKFGVCLWVTCRFSVVVKGGYWGAPMENGTWNGMIGTVMRKVRRADDGMR